MLASAASQCSYRQVVYKYNSSIIDCELLIDMEEPFLGRAKTNPNNNKKNISGYRCQWRYLQLLYNYTREIMS